MRVSDSMKLHKIIGTVLLLSLSLSCDRGEIVHLYNLDVSGFSKLKTTKDIDLYRLPKPHLMIAAKGTHIASNSWQPDGIMDWVEFDMPSNTVERNVTINLRVFNNEENAKHFFKFDAEGRWWKPSLISTTEEYYQMG